jgi:competence protein ComEC
MSPRPAKTAIAVISALALLDILVWFQIISGIPKSSEEIHFLDVGQGDAVLVVLPGGIKVLTDAGPDSRVRRGLEKVLPVADRYLDLAIISHSQLDHFGGFKELLRSYKFGAFLWNGKEADASGPWGELISDIRGKNIPLITVLKGDKIRSRDAVIQILSPDFGLLGSAEPNDTALVQMLRTPSFRFLSPADVGAEIEKRLVREFELRADILKVGHHGSKYSSGEEFLARVQPRLAVVSAGRNNRYGHPAPETLRRLRSAGAEVLRTDKEGTISVVAENGRLKVFLAGN